MKCDLRDYANDFRCVSHCFSRGNRSVVQLCDADKYLQLSVHSYPVRTSKTKYLSVSPDEHWIPRSKPHDPKRPHTFINDHERSCFAVFIVTVLRSFINGSFTLTIRPVTTCFDRLLPLFRRFSTTKYDRFRSFLVVVILVLGTNTEDLLERRMLAKFSRGSEKQIFYRVMPYRSITSRSSAPLRDATHD